jgi:hypothetical protein
MKNLLDILNETIEEKLPNFLKKENEELWNSTEVIYHAPRVERLWMQMGEYRIFLHRIYPCQKEEALFHPHPWPCAVKIINGTYEMGISTEYPDEDKFETEKEPAWTSEHARLILGAGSSYEMSDRTAWHYVLPINNPSDSIMIIGKPYSPAVSMPISPNQKQPPLYSERFNQLMEEWRKRYPC